MALSQSDTAKFAMAVKNARPDITDEELSALVQEAGQVNDDPVKSQALAMKMLPQLNTQLADPYKGTGYTSADSMKQFDPAQMRAALAAQQAAYQQNQPSRAIGGILAGSSGSADVMNKNKSDWEGIDKQNMLQSIEAQKMLQDQATSGINAAKGVQDMAQTAGKYAGTQLEQQQKLQGNQLSLEQQKRLNLATSPETMFAKKLMASQLQSNPALANDPDLKKALTDPNVTAQVLMGFMDPKVLDAYKKQVGIAKEGAEAAIGQAVANNVAGTSTPVIGDGSPLPSTTIASGPTPTFNFKPGTDMRAVRAVMAKSAPEHLAAFDAQFPDAATAPPQIAKPTLNVPGGSQMSTSFGGVTIAPSPATQLAGTGTIGAQLDTEKNLQAYDSGGATSMKNILADLKAGTYSGAGADKWAEQVPTSKQAALKQKLFTLNQQMPGLFPTDANGSSTISMDGKTIANTIAQGMARMEVARQRSQIIKNKYNNDMTAFSSSEDAKQLNQKVPMINKQGQVILSAPRGTAGYNAAMKDGFVEASNFSSL